MISVKLLDEKCRPTKAYVGDAGWDVYTREDAVINPLDTVKLPLGFILNGDRGMSYNVEDKSGLALSGLSSCGNIIDNGYRGECHAVLRNLSNSQVTVKKYQKVAQVVPYRILDDDILVITENDGVDTKRTVLEHNATQRGAEGFGSSGI